MQQYTIIKLHPRHFAWPLGSLLHDLCLKECRDIHEASIPGGMDLGFFDFIGFATVVDSLAAIKKLIYEEKKIPWQELLAALVADFDGHDITRAFLQHAPKYGNDDAYAPLSDGASASQGADENGPTAVLLLSNYASKNLNFRNRAARLLNLKFSSSCLAGERGTKKLTSFIRTWCDLHLWHVQFNVINRETLLAAQREPEKYRNLIARIAGYSAYFVELSRDLQNDLIARTEHIAV